MCKSFRPAKLPTLATDSDRFSQTRRGILNLCFICGEFSAALLRGPGWRFRFLLWSYADLFQERLDRLFPPQELLDGDVHIARIAWFVNFATQSQTGLFVEVTILGFFKHGCHIGCDRVEYPFVPDPVLQHLRRRFNKVTGNMSPGKAAVLRTSDNRMESVTKLVKQCFHIGMRQQRWLVCGGGREIAEQGDSWPLVFSIR